MIGVARQAAVAQQDITDHYKGKPLGVLDEQECRKFIEVLDRLQETEERLYHFVKVRIEHENETEKREALEKLKSLHENVSQNININENNNERLA